MSEIINKVPERIKFVNTAEFSREAQGFTKNGYYTNAPKGTFAYKEYWDEQERRCKQGFVIAGTRITGEHYAYLNFGRIKVTVGEGKSARKYESFPRFLDMDYYYYHELEKAKNNREGMIVAKSRRKGFSYKGSFNTVYEYTWYRDSFSIISAFLKDYCQSTMNMAVDMINFINKHTAWGKRKLIDKRDHLKSGFKETVNDIQVESGYKSEIVTISFKDDPFKSIGKSSSVMLFEEAGKWNGLIESYMLSKPLFSDGDIMVGIPIVYGTGGDMEGGTADFAEMFYSPSAYGLRSYENIYDENAVGECGWFVDDMWFKLPHVDKDGNSDRASAEKELDLQRDLTRKKSNSKKAIDTFISQHPKTPQEAFLKGTGNIFPVAEILGTLAKLELDKKYEQRLLKGDLVLDENGLPEFKENKASNIIYRFPLKKTDNTDAPIIIYEPPYYDDQNKVPNGLYIASTDPFQQDIGGTSLASTYVMHKLTKRIVAEYTAKPETTKIYYENVRRLLLYYNCRSLYENNIKGMYDYFESKNCLYLLAQEPMLIVERVLKNPGASRKYGIRMGEEIKRYGESLIYNWLVDYTDESKTSMNIHKIRSIGLLKELAAYDPDPKKNFDRVSALICLMYYMEEERRYIPQIEDEKKVLPIIERGFLGRGFRKPTHQIDF